MRPIDIHTANAFASEFAIKRKGFALKEITPFFESYQPGMPVAADGMGTPLKSDHFTTCVMALTPQNQRYSLHDLCCAPPAMKGAVPDEPVRLRLLKMLTQADGTSPLAVTLSRVSVAGVRDDWFVAASRLAQSPSAAVTAARTLLEATCKTVLTELGETPDASGDLKRLVKQARKALRIEKQPSAAQSVVQLCTGLTSVVDGLAGMSNQAGDRHGLAATDDELSSSSLAGLAVHSAGTLSLFLSQAYVDQRTTPAAHS